MMSKNLIAKIFLWKRFSSFTYLNITQFLVTINDSIFRLLVAFSLIKKLGQAESSNILFISGILFVSPFLIFSMPAGELADKCSKKKVIVWTLVLEVLGMLYGVYAMAQNSEFNAYASLFCVALQASIFLPSKYAILPEIVQKEDLSKANGYMTLATYLAIIFGTFLASFFTQITNENYVIVALFCLIIAILGFITSLQIETTPVKNAAKKIKVFFLLEVYRSLKLAKKYPHLLTTVLAGSYFLYTASFTQLNIIPFGIQSLKITDVQAGYVFLAAALGIGIGSITVAMISGKNVELGISIWGAFGTSISYIILFLFSKSLIIAILMILSLGINGGLYIVPIDAYVQLASPEKDRGEIVAAGSFMGFVGVFLAALSLGLFSNVFHFTAAMGYLIIGLLSLIVSLTITILLPEYVSRILAVTLFRAFYHIFPHHQPQTDFYESALIISERYSFIKVLSLIYLFPRINFVRFVKRKPIFFIKPFYSLLHIMPIPTKSEADFSDALKIAKEKQYPLCVFLDSKKRVPPEADYLDQLLASEEVPKIFIRLEKSHPRGQKSGLLNFFKILPIKLEAFFSDKKAESLTPAECLERVKRLN